MTARSLAECMYLTWCSRTGQAPVAWNKIAPEFRGTFVRAADALVTEVLGRGAAEPEGSDSR